MQSRRRDPTDALRSEPVAKATTSNSAKSNVAFFLAQHRAEDNTLHGHNSAIQQLCTYFVREDSNVRCGRERKPQVKRLCSEAVLTHDALDAVGNVIKSLLSSPGAQELPWGMTWLLRIDGTSHSKKNMSTPVLLRPLRYKTERPALWVPTPHLKASQDIFQEHVRTRLIIACQSVVDLLPQCSLRLALDGGDSRTFAVPVNASPVC